MNKRIVYEEVIEAIDELITQYKTNTHEGSTDNCSLCKLYMNYSVRIGSNVCKYCIQYNDEYLSCTEMFTFVLDYKEEEVKIRIEFWKKAKRIIKSIPKDKLTREEINERLWKLDERLAKKYNLK